MTRPRANRKPTFFWQAALILLPVVVLAAVGLLSLRQDKLLAEQEAREQAQAIAVPLAHECGTRLKIDIEEFAEASWRHEQVTGLIAGTLSPVPGQEAAEEIRNAQTIVAGWQQEHPTVQLAQLPKTRCSFREDVLFDPPHYSRVPEPPEWFVGLSSEGTAKWDEAETAWGRGDLAAAHSALETIARTRPDDPLRANAELRLLLIEPEPSDPADRVRALLQLARKFPGVQTETGLPLSGIVCHHALRLAHSGEAFDAILDGFVFHIQHAPSILTGKLLTEIEGRAKAEDSRSQERVRAIESVWTAQERARDLTRGVSPAQLARPDVVELKSESGRFLAFCSPSVGVTTNSTVTATNAASTTVSSGILLVPLTVIDQALQKATRRGSLRQPDYAAVRLHLPVGAEGFRYPRAVTVTPASPNRSGQLLATVADGVSLGSYFPFTLDLELADPDLLFARHRQRVWMFGGLIILAAATAVAGLLSAWKGFHRQQRLAEMKTNFVSSVSHELRAPIASVRLMAESLERGKISGAPKQAEYFRLIVQECRRLTSLIENVLDFSRIDQGGKQYEFEPTDLVPLVEQTVQLMEPYATERQVTLARSPSNPQPATDNLQPAIDGRALQQALVNLLDNAIKHSPPGSVVTIGLKMDFEAVSRESAAVPPTGQQKQTFSSPQQGVIGGFTTAATLCLWVEDQGEGIPPEEHDRIFEPFYRRGTELRRETRGVGIGLTIVKHIVEAHGGRVLVRSTPGQGSRFTIELPCNQCPKPKVQ